MKALFTSVLFALTCGVAFASTATGTIQTIIVQASSSGGTRVSILTTANTACAANNGWFAFEFSGTTGSGFAWLAGFYAAKATGESVTIHGTGTCDQYGVEELSYVLFN